MLQEGLYEELISELLYKELNKENLQLLIEKEQIDEEESHQLLAKYVGNIVEKALLQLRNKLPEQIGLTNKLITFLAQETNNPDLQTKRIHLDNELLLAAYNKVNSNFVYQDKIIRPITPISQSSLFTGSLKEPSLASEIKKEILTADKVDMLISFVKWSGIRIIETELKEFTSRPHSRLRIITTSYMKATDYKAIEFLAGLPNTEIKVSYDTNRTRLHAKAYLFHRDTGFTTAYIGSSNLSNPALTDGLEWNLKVTAKDSSHIIQKFEGTFEAYWNDKEFIRFEEQEKGKLQLALSPDEKTEDNFAFFFDLVPFSYQQEILEKLKAEREIHQRYRNLIVAATGTGKTVISAFDYKNFVLQNPKSKNRLLFVAHREEILKQSLACFRAVLKDQNFGALLVGNFKPNQIDHLFISIQSFNSKEFQENTTPDFYDFIVVDEFHHAAATSYQTLLDYYQPKILLGLTATPERMDGKSIEAYFGNVTAAEIRLYDALNRKLLSPFQYFGITDIVDYASIAWKKGYYDIANLTEILNRKERANLVIQAVHKYVRNVKDVIGLGFCVSIEHANFMAMCFNEAGIPSVALLGNSDKELRKIAPKQLIAREINFIFTVDIFNEGVDIPQIDTVLFLRPTESLTVFLQQLGRGLRLSPEKECLTVLDFIGQAHKSYSFENKFKALIGQTANTVYKEVENDFPHLPAGCVIQLEKLAKEHILHNIKGALNNNKSQIIQRIKHFSTDTGKELSLINFVTHYQLSLYDIYDRACWHRLLKEAGKIADFNETDEEQLTKGIKRILHINSRRFIQFILNWITNNGQVDLQNIDNQKFALMLHYNFWFESGTKWEFQNVYQSLERLFINKWFIQELKEVLDLCYQNIHFIDKPLALPYKNVLDLHCLYTRDEILAAFDFYSFDKKKSQREGVLHLADKQTDLLFITLNKSEKEYSTTTMYEDYVINEYLFHWQSQSTTSETSKTGQRYINHQSLGNTILLFVRNEKKFRGSGVPYYFLGKANYVKHEGSLPMSITWELEENIPAHLLQASNVIIS